MYAGTSVHDRCTVEHVLHTTIFIVSIAHKCVQFSLEIVVCHHNQRWSKVHKVNIFAYTQNLEVVLTGRGFHYLSKL